MTRDERDSLDHTLNPVISLLIWMSEHGPQHIDEIDDTNSSDALLNSAYLGIIGDSWLYLTEKGIQACIDFKILKHDLIREIPS